MHSRDNQENTFSKIDLNRLIKNTNCLFDSSRQSYKVEMNSLDLVSDSYIYIPVKNVEKLFTVKPYGFENVWVHRGIPVYLFLIEKRERIGVFPVFNVILDVNGIKYVADIASTNHGYMNTKNLDLIDSRVIDSTGIDKGIITFSKAIPYVDIGIHYVSHLEYIED